MELLTGCMRRKYWDRAQLPGWEYEVNWWYQIFNLYWKKVFHQIQFEGEWGRRQTCLCPVQWLAGGGGEWCHSFLFLDELAHEPCAMYWFTKILLVRIKSWTLRLHSERWWLYKRLCFESLGLTKDQGPQFLKGGLEGNLSVIHG